MLRKHAQFFNSLFVLSDLCVLFATWILSYFLSLLATPIKPSLPGIPSFSVHAGFSVLLLFIWALVSKWFTLYHPRRMERFRKEILDILKSLTLTTFVLIAVIYLFFKQFEFSRLAFFYFWATGFVGLIATRFSIRITLQALRARGYNQRHAIIAGTGELGRKVLEEIELYPYLGIRIIGFLSPQGEEVGNKIKDVPVIGVYEDIDKTLELNKIDLFFFALPINEYGYFERLVEKVQGNLSEIKVVSPFYEFSGLRGGMDALGDLPIASLQSSSLYGWDSVFKRVFDLLIGTLLVMITFPVMVIIGCLIKLTSRGAALYRQERVGMDGCVFRMLKFRTMKVDAEKETGPIWTREDDPRRTKVGSFLRRFSLDELPQLFNVLRGEMSLVGPRPERPVFVEDFRSKIPFYMLRHKIKAGMTGWAQVNGWRGNTSLEKRIEHDLYYIQNWSIVLDLRILLMTLRRGIFSESGY